MSAIVCAIPVAISLAYMLAIYMPRNRGGSGPDKIPDFAAVVPVFVMMILGPIGLIFSIAALTRREPFAGLLLAFYAVATFIFFVH